MNIKDLKNLQIQYLSDRRIATLNNEIAALYNITIPKGIVRALDGSIILIYEDKTNKEVKRIQSIISDIIKDEYLELIKYQDLHESKLYNNSQTQQEIINQNEILFNKPINKLK